ncbi:MAG: protein translocase subunit SecF [Actinobacteria bacterium]|nr:protein translocase subunit SecF [Actinomycetota bacterium]
MMHYDFMGKKYIWFAVSGLIILVGMFSLLTRGLNLSIDFKSGSRLDISFNRDTSVDEVRSATATAGYGDAVVQTLGDGRYQVSLPELSNDQQVSLISSLDSQIGVSDKSWQVVGPTFGSQVVSSMLKAIVISWLLMIAYVSFRFEYKYAVATIVALIHDLAITVGVYSIVGREVTTATVAAVLTILGYSLYDTIIVFDRVRENAPRARRGAYAAMVNESIWEVMGRSIITSVLTLMPVVCLLLFGGATLKDFAFALMVGIISGAYSSIFVAAPLLTLWKEREPRYRQVVKGAVRAAKSAGSKATGSKVSGSKAGAAEATGAKSGKGKGKGKGKGGARPARAR